MERSAFAYRVLMALGFGVVLVMVFVAAYAGLLSNNIQSLLHTKLAPAIALYRAHPDVFHLAILTIGTGVSAVTASLAILKAFYYAEWSLPARLQDLIEKAKTDHLEERPKLLAHVRGQFRTKDFLVPALFANPFSQLLHMFGISTTHFLARSYAVSVDRLAEEIVALKLKQEDIENRKITGHLLRAEYYSALSVKIASDTPEWGMHVGASLAEYKLALQCRGDILEALEGAVRQMELLNESPSELGRLLRRCGHAARRTRQLLQQARGQRKIAEIDEALGTPKGLESARAHLDAARGLLEPVATEGSPERVELATVLLSYGRVQKKRERLDSARRALEAARKLFNELADQDGADRASALIDRLEE